MQRGKRDEGPRGKTLRGRVKVLRDVFGHLCAIDLTTDLVEKQQVTWQGAGLTNADY